MYVFSETAHRQLELARDGLTFIRDLAASAAGDRDLALSPEQLVSMTSLISDQLSDALRTAQWLGRK
jgi:hypothetical protein